MTDHLKLTDESLDRYERRILGDDFTDDEIDQLFAAIRALRDAARDLAIEVTHNPGATPLAMVAASGRLWRLLPDEPKGGG